MARLDQPRRQTFRPSDFQRFPVWTWDEEMKLHLPIDEVYPEPDDYRGLFVRAHLRAGEQEFDGYLIGGYTFFGFGIFVGNQNFIFNLNLPEMNSALISDVSKATGIFFTDFFPVYYTSDVRFADGKIIDGKFE